jgi:tetratricopeptide (TPR) repeat protein
MKAEHRHELKTNELAEWIANLPQWCKENLITIAIVFAVVIIAAGSYFYHNYQTKTVYARERVELTRLLRGLAQDKQRIIRSATQGIDYSFVLLQSAKDLLAFADAAKDDELAAFALIKRGESLRSELHYRPKTVSEQELNTQIDSARESYRQALQRPMASASLRAVAKLCLGLCEEELGNFDEARQIYEEILADPNFESTTARVQAEQRLQTMDDYKQQVVFRVLPEPQAVPPASDANQAAAPVVLPLPQDEEGPVPLPALDTNAFEANLTDTNLAGANVVLP